MTLQHNNYLKNIASSSLFLVELYSHLSSCAFVSHSLSVSYLPSCTLPHSSYYLSVSHSSPMFLSISFSPVLPQFSQLCYTAQHRVVHAESYREEQEQKEVDDPANVVCCDTVLAVFCGCAGLLRRRRLSSSLLQLFTQL